MDFSSGRSLNATAVARHWVLPARSATCKVGRIADEYGVIRNTVNPDIVRIHGGGARYPRADPGAHPERHSRVLGLSGQR